MIVACRKRRVPLEDLRQATLRIERDLLQEGNEEVSTRAVGARVLAALLTLDSVAYVRFASVYQEFETVEDFRQLVESFASRDTVLPRSVV